MTPGPPLFVGGIQLYPNRPNAAGQQTLAALTACYLNANRQPPDPFAPGGPPIHTLPDRLVTPAQLHMVPAPGLTTVPGSGQIPLCHA